MMTGGGQRQRGAGKTAHAARRRHGAIETGHGARRHAVTRMRQLLLLLLVGRSGRRKRRRTVFIMMMRRRRGVTAGGNEGRGLRGRTAVGRPTRMSSSAAAVVRPRVRRRRMLLTRLHLQNGAVRTAVGESRIAAADADAVHIGDSGTTAIMRVVMRRRRWWWRVRRHDAFAVAVHAQTAPAAAVQTAIAAGHHASMVEVILIAVVGTLGLGQFAGQLLTLSQGLLLLALEPLLFGGDGWVVGRGGGWRDGWWMEGQMVE